MPHHWSPVCTVLIGCRCLLSVNDLEDLLKAARYDRCLFQYNILHQTHGAVHDVETGHLPLTGILTSAEIPDGYSLSSEFVTKNAGDFVVRNTIARCGLQ